MKSRRGAPGRRLTAALRAHGTDLVHLASPFVLGARGYFERLSDASRYTLGLQGGTMSAAEVTEFATHPYSRDAIAVRLWDEAAKDPSVLVPGFDHYRPLLRRLLIRSRADGS